MGPAASQRPPADPKLPLASALLESWFKIVCGVSKGPPSLARALPWLRLGLRRPPTATSRPQLALGLGAAWKRVQDGVLGSAWAPRASSGHQQTPSCPCPRRRVDRTSSCCMAVNKGPLGCASVPLAQVGPRAAARGPAADPSLPLTSAPLRSGLKVGPDGAKRAPPLARAVAWIRLGPTGVQWPPAGVALALGVVWFKTGVLSSVLGGLLT